MTPTQFYLMAMGFGGLVGLGTYAIIASAVDSQSFAVIISNIAVVASTIVLVLYESQIHQVKGGKK